MADLPEPANPYADRSIASVEIYNLCDGVVGRNVRAVGGTVDFTLTDPSGGSDGPRVTIGVVVEEGQSLPFEALETQLLHKALFALRRIASETPTTLSAARPKSRKTQL